MTTNNFEAIAAALNNALYSHIGTINIEGKPGTFAGELTKRIIDLKSEMGQMISDIREHLSNIEAAPPHGSLYGEAVI